MKKLLAVLLALLMIFAFTACGKDTADVDETEITDSETSDIESMTLVYDIDEKEVTIYKPSGCEFFNAEQDGSDLITIKDNDMAWIMDVWASTVYKDGSGEPFASYYFNGELDDYWAEEMTSFEQTVTELGFEYDGKPVKRIESTYLEEGEEEEETEIFVGVEFESTRNGEHFGDGLLGFKLSMYDEVPSDEELARLFKETFGI